MDITKDQLKEWLEFACILCFSGALVGLAFRCSTTTSVSASTSRQGIEQPEVVERSTIEPTAPVIHTIKKDTNHARR